MRLQREALQPAPEDKHGKQPPQKGGLTRRQFLVGLGLTAGAAVFEGIAYKIASDRDPSLLGIKKNPNETSTDTATATKPATPSPSYLESWQHNELQAPAIASAFTYEGNLAKAPLGPLLISAATPDGKSPFDAQNPLIRQHTDYGDALVPQNPNALTFNDPDFAEKVGSISVQGFPLSEQTITDKNGIPWLIGYVGVFDHEGLTAQEGTNPYFVPVRFIANTTDPDLKFAVSYISTDGQVGGSGIGDSPAEQNTAVFAKTFQNQIAGKKDVLFDLFLFTGKETFPPGHEGIVQTYTRQTPVVLDFLRHGAKSATANMVVKEGFDPDTILFTHGITRQS